MTTNYPGGLDPETNFVPDVPSNPVGSTTPTLVQSNQNMSDAIRAIQTELGTDPASDYTDVKSRLDRSKKGIFYLADYDTTHALGDGDDWSNAFVTAITAAQNEGGGTIFLPGFTMEVTSPIFLPSRITLKGANRAASIIKLRDETDMDSRTEWGNPAVDYRCIIESGINAIITGERFFADGWDTSSNLGVFDSWIEDVTIDGNRENQTGANGSGGVGLFGAPIGMSNVLIRDCTGWGLMTDWGGDAYGPSYHVDGTGSSSVPHTVTGTTIDGASLEAIFDRIVLMDNDAGNWWAKGPHDGIAHHIVSVLQQGAKCDHGIIIDGGSWQIGKVHCWGGDAKCHAWIETSTGRFVDFVAEGAEDTQVILQGSAGSQITGLNCFAQGNLNQRAISMAWCNDWQIEGRVNVAGPGGGLYLMGDNDAYGKFQVTGGSGQLDSVTIAGLNGGADLLNSANVPFNTDAHQTAVDIAADIEDLGSRTIRAYAADDWVYISERHDDLPAEPAENPTDGTAIVTTGTLGITHDTIAPSHSSTLRGWRRDKLAWGFPGNGSGPHNQIKLNIDLTTDKGQQFDLTQTINASIDNFTIDNSTWTPNHSMYDYEAHALIKAAAVSGYVYDYVIEIGTERMLVTDQEGDRIWVVRGHDSTTPAGHTSGDEITRITDPVQGPWDDQSAYQITWERMATGLLPDSTAARSFFKTGTTNGAVAFFGDTTGALKGTVNTGTADQKIDALMVILDAYGLVTKNY